MLRHEYDCPCTQAMTSVQDFPVRQLQHDGEAQSDKLPSMYTVYGITRRRDPKQFSCHDFPFRIVPFFIGHTFNLSKDSLL